MAVVVINLVWPLVYFVQLAIIKTEQSELVLGAEALENTTTITLTAEEADKYLIDDESELNINGKMYDVVDSKMQDNRYVFEVIADDDESLLNELFAAIKKHHQKHRTQHKTVSMFLFYSTYANALPVYYLHEAEKGFADYTKSHIHPGYFAIQSPPPKVA